jgi:hypothetical protein
MVFIQAEWFDNSHSAPCPCSVSSKHGDSWPRSGVCKISHICVSMMPLLAPLGFLSSASIPYLPENQFTPSFSPLDCCSTFDGQCIAVLYKHSVENRSQARMSFRTWPPSLDDYAALSSLLAQRFNMSDDHTIQPNNSLIGRQTMVGNGETHFQWIETRRSCDFSV